MTLIDWAHNVRSTWLHKRVLYAEERGAHTVIWTFSSNKCSEKYRQHKVYKDTVIVCSYYAIADGCSWSLFCVTDDKLSIGPCTLGYSCMQPCACSSGVYQRLSIQPQAPLASPTVRTPARYQSCSLKGLEHTYMVCCTITQFQVSENVSSRWSAHII